jgi:D-xylose transport system permease protein
MTATTAPARANPLGTITAKLELDTRLIGMLAALAIIWVGFDLLSGGVFLTPRNPLEPVGADRPSVAIMATGMVLLIVSATSPSRSAAILGFVGMVSAWGRRAGWPECSVSTRAHRRSGARRGCHCGLIGLFHGWLIAYLAIPPSS